jgi:translocation and assembly module TamB
MRRRVLIIILSIALILIPLGLLGSLIYTQKGVQILAAQLSRFERLGVHIEGISGTLAGPLHVDKFELDHPRVHVVVYDITVQLQLRGLLYGTIQAGSLTARDALIEYRDVQLPPSAYQPHFLPSFLRIDVRHADVARARYVHPNGFSIEATRARGRVTITAHRLQARDFRVEADWFDATGEMLLRAKDAFEMDLKTQATVHVRPELDVQLAASLSGPIDRLAMHAQMLRPTPATADAQYGHEGDAWNITGRFESGPFPLQGWVAHPPFSFDSASLGFRLNAAGIAVDGDVVTPDYTLGELHVKAHGRYAQRTLFLDDSSIAVSGTLGVIRTAGNIAFTGDSPTLDLHSTFANLQWPLRGAPVVRAKSGILTLGGSLPYTYEVDGQFTAPRIADAHGHASGLLAQDRLTIGSYEVQALGGAARGKGTLQYAEPRAWTLTTEAVGINPRGLNRDFPGHISFSAVSRGEGVDTSANFQTTWSRLRGTLRNQLLRGSGGLQREGKTWRAHDINLEFGNARISIDGSVNEAVDLRWTIDVPNLQTLVSDAQGSLHSHGLASGSFKAPRVLATLAAEDVRYESWFAQHVSIDADVDASNALPSRLSLQANGLGRGEPAIASLSIDGRGTALDHQITLAMTGIAKPQQPASTAKLSLNGAYDREVWKATLASTQVAHGGTEVHTAAPTALLVSKHQVSLDKLCFVVSSGQLCGEGNWQRNGAWNAAVSGYEIPLALILPSPGAQAQYAGRIEGSAKFFGGANQPWQGEAGMRIINADIIYKPPGAAPEVLHLGTGGLAAHIKPERVDFSFGVQAFTDTYVHANAYLLRNGSNDLLHVPLTANVRARAADANILPLIFPEIDHAAGLLLANASIGGTLAQPTIDGRIELSNGEFDSYRVNFALRQLHVIAQVAANQLSFQGSGRAGDGQLKTSGQLTWQDLVSRGTLHLTGKNLLVADLPDYRIVASPDLHFDIDGRTVTASGSVTIPSALIQPAKLTGAVRASDDATYVGETPEEKAGRLVVHSDIRINMGDDVRVDAFGLQGRIVGGVETIVHTGETPLGRGELGVESGRYEAYGQKLEINRGRLLFDNAPLDDPGLDIEARRKIETVTVGLNVRGTLQEPRLTFFSDPSMSQTQIVSYLIVGKPIGDSQSAAAVQTRSTRDTVALQGGGFLAAQLGKRIGLEEVGVESTTNSAGTTNTALVLGKFLSPRLFISYGISLTEAINTLKLRYTVGDNWVLRTESGEAQSADVEYTWEK